MAGYSLRETARVFSIIEIEQNYLSLQSLEMEKKRNKVSHSSNISTMSVRRAIRRHHFVSAIAEEKKKLFERISRDYIASGTIVARCYGVLKKRVIIYPLLGTVVGFAASRSISWCFPSFVTFMLFHFPKEASTDVAHVDGGSCTESMAIFFRRNDSIG